MAGIFKGGWGTWSCYIGILLLLLLSEFDVVPPLGQRLREKDKPEATCHL